MNLVLTEDHGRVRVLTLNRPDARNALSAALRQDLILHLHEALNNAAIGAVVITGAGTAFAAGADVNELLARSSDEQRHFLQPPHIYSVIEEAPKPVVAAIQGHALGAGLELATACDVRVCSEDAKLGQPEINLGLIPGGGGTQRLPRLLGRGQASRLILSGKPVTGTEALALGLVDLVVPRGDVVPQAIALAQEMAAHDPAALAAAKRALRAAHGPPEAGLALEIDEFVKLHGRAETRANLQAFLNKAAKA